jgi:hypothetical protein
MVHRYGPATSDEQKLKKAYIQASLHADELPGEHCLSLKSNEILSVCKLVEKYPLTDKIFLETLF